MRRLFVAGVIGVAIALSSCQAGIQNQIKGKWQKISEVENSETICSEEYLEKYMIDSCTNGSNPPSVITSSYEIAESNRIVLTSTKGKGVTDIFEVKIIGDEMEQKLSNGKLVKFKKIK